MRKDHGLYSQLKWAVRNGHKDRIKSLLECGAPGNAPLGMHHWRCPLLSSIHLGDLEIVKMLLTKGASPNVKPLNNDTVLIMAAKLEKYAIVDLFLLTKGLENCRSEENITHVHIACIRNNVDVVKKLVQSKEDISVSVDNESLYWPGFTALHFAVQYKCFETVQYLLSIGADITAQDARTLTPLHLADMQRNEPIIDLILLAHMNVVSNPKNSQRLSHFHIACTRNNLEVVKFFLKIGVHLEEYTRSKDYPTFSAMDFAIYYECIDVVRLLLLHGECVRSPPMLGRDRLEDAYDSGNPELVNLMLTRMKRSDRESAKVEKIPNFHISCRRDSTDCIRELATQIPGNLNLQLWNGCTPLHLAIERRDKEIIKFLVNQGADISIKNEQGNSPLHLAIEKGKEFVNLILDDVNVIERDPVNSDGLSHLHIFCTSSVINSKKPSIIEKFIELGSDVDRPVNMNSKFWAGFTPLHFAAKFGCDKIVRILLSSGALYSAIDHSNLSAFDWCIKDTYDSYLNEKAITAFKIMEIISLFHSRHKLDAFDDRGYSLLHILSFSYSASLKRIRELISKNPLDLNKVISHPNSPCNGYTPLHIAVRCENEELARLLIEMGANILAKDANGNTPVHLASIYSDFFEIPMSLHDPDILRLNPMGSTGYTLFHVACAVGNIEMMKRFVHHGVDVNSPTHLSYADFYDKQPLHLVMFYNPRTSAEAVRFLLDNGADPNARDSKMNTPLHYMSSSKVDIINTLIGHGADVNALNVNLETPILKASSLDYMKDDNMNENMTSFLANGADINMVDEYGNTPVMIDTWTDRESEQCYYYKTADTLLKHVLKLDVIGHFVSDQNKKAYSTLLEKISNRLDEIGFKDRCFQESERMSRIPIANRTTLRDILFRGLNELAAISENDAFVKIVSAQDFCDEFPIYGPMLVSRLRLGRARRPLLRKAHEALNFLSGVSLPSVCTEIIFQSFSNEDLKFVISSTKQRFRLSS